MTFAIEKAVPPLYVRKQSSYAIINDANDKWVATINTDAGADPEAVKDLIEAQIKAKAA